MTYPILNFDDAERCFYSYLNEGQYSSDLFKVKKSDAFNLNFNDQIISDLLTEFISVFENSEKSWEIDKNIFIKIHSILNIDSKISEDQDFWRFISFSERGRFLELIKRRYFKNKDLEDISESQFKKYCGLGTSSASCLEGYFKRCWEVGNILFDEKSKDDPYHLITQGPKDVDFYISHITRINIGGFENLTKSFTKFIIDENLPRGDKKTKKVGYRQLIRVLNALQGNYVLPCIDFNNSYNLIKHLWNDRDKWVKLF